MRLGKPHGRRSKHVVPKKVENCEKVQNYIQTAAALARHRPPRSGQSSRKLLPAPTFRKDSTALPSFRIQIHTFAQSRALLGVLKAALHYWTDVPRMTIPASFRDFSSPCGVQVSTRLTHEVPYAAPQDSNDTISSSHGILRRARNSKRQNISCPSFIRTRIMSS